MENKIKSSALMACRLLLGQVTSVLLRCGVTWKEFSTLSKDVFVEKASEDFGIKGRKTNISRVSILTGISRKEIKRLRDTAGTETEPLVRKTTQATQLLTGWYQDPEFQDANGRPNVLVMTGDLNSFEQLHKRYGGDVPMQTMLKELLNTKTVESEKVGGETHLTVKRRYFLHQQLDPEMLLYMGENLCDLAKTLKVNVTQDEKLAPLFEGRATVAGVDKKYEKDFYEFLDKKGQEFLETVDAWLSERQVPENESSIKTIRLGAGAYTIHGINRVEIQNEIS